MTKCFKHIEHVKALEHEITSLSKLDETTAVSAGADCSIMFWEVLAINKMRVIKRLEDHSAGVSSLLNWKGEFLLSGSANG